MGFLYGDSTPSPLEVNFIDFLRGALDFSVRALLADQSIGRHREGAAGLQRAAEATITRLQNLYDAVTFSVQDLSTTEADAAVESCGTEIARAASELVRTAVGQQRSTLASEISKLEAQAAGERAEIVKALETLLLRYDLPDTDLRTQIRAFGATRYGARLIGTTPFGLELTLDLEIPPNHLFGAVVRVDRVLAHLELLVPEHGRREARPRHYHLQKYYVTEFAIGVTGSAIKLREAFEAGSAGLDIVLGGEDRHVRLVRVGDHDAGLAPDLPESEANKLRMLYEKLAAPVTELNRHRKALVEASLDGHPLRDHERPAVLVERLIQHVAPIVREIAARSSSADELVLRRLLGENRREEIFVSKSELKHRLDALPASLCRCFEPLGLDSATNGSLAGQVRTSASGTAAGTISGHSGGPENGSR